MIAWTVQLTQAQVQWFASANTLQPNVYNVKFSFNPLPSSQGYLTGFALVNASVANPSYNGAIQLLTVYYTVFVDNSTNGFSVQGSSQVGISVATYQETIPARGSLNLTSNVDLTPDVILKLQPFLKQQYNVFVLIGLNLDSTYGTLALQYCFETPNKILSTCPSPRASSRGGGGGG